jgi:hypothetical protein
VNAKIPNKLGITPRLRSEHTPRLRSEHTPRLRSVYKLQPQRGEIIIAPEGRNHNGRNANITFAS